MPRPNPDIGPAPLTTSVEDYLKAIYELERASGAAATTDLASQLQLAPASITGMIRRLAGQGLLIHEPYKGARLTARGKAGALRILRRHRVIESYLVRALGYRWDEVHDEAERLEHAASDEMVNRMAAAIGQPRVDPHGAPIPSREGAVDEPVYPSLDEVDVGAWVEVMRVTDEDPELLRHLADLELKPGCVLRIIRRAPFGGPLTLQVERSSRRRLVGPSLAERLLVRPKSRRARR